MLNTHTTNTNNQQPIPLTSEGGQSSELPAGVALKIHWRDNHTLCSLTKNPEEKKSRKNNTRYIRTQINIK
ncbi:hypothetical protein MHYP_G00020310 [Metynnis hypsauchen]